MLSERYESTEVDRRTWLHVPSGTNFSLKLVRILLKYHVLGTSTVIVSPSNDHSLHAPIYLGWTSCLISFAWDQSTCQERVESDKIQNEKVLPKVGLEPTTMRLEPDALPACWILSMTLLRI